MVVAFLMWSGSEFQTEGPNERMNAQSPPVRNLQGGSGRGTGAGTRLKWPRRRIQLRETRQTGWSGSGGNSVETEVCKFRKFERQRAATEAVRVSVWCVGPTVTEAHRLQAELPLASWCFEPSQLKRIISGLKTNFNPSPNYSFHKL